MASIKTPAKKGKLQRGKDGPRINLLHLKILQGKAMNRSYITEKIYPSKPGAGQGDGQAREKSIYPMGVEQHTNYLIHTLHKDSILNGVGRWLTQGPGALQSGVHAPALLFTRSWKVTHCQPQFPHL